MTKVTGFSEKELAESVTACDEVSIIYETKKTKNPKTIDIKIN